MSITTYKKWMKEAYLYEADTVKFKFDDDCLNSNLSNLICQRLIVLLNLDKTLNNLSLI